MFPAVLVAAAWSCLLAAQVPSLAEDRLRMPAGLPPAVDVVAADFDGDGLPDLARASAQALTILFQQPSGAFAASPQQVGLTFPQPVRAVALAHTQAASALPDLVVTLQTGAPSVLWNSGRGIFVRAPVSMPLAPGPHWRTLPGNFDGVAGDDLLVLPEQGRLQLFLYAGGSYTDASALLGAGVFVQSPRAAFTDLDRDGDDDLVVASGVSGQPFVIENNVTSVRVVPLPVRGAYTAVTTADFNRDGRVDIALARSTPVGLEFVLNLATGFVAYVPSGPLVPGAEVLTMTATDIGGDGDPDLAVLLVDGRAALALHDGQPVFQLSLVALPVDQGPRTGLVALDLETDGDIDLVLVGGRGDSAGMRDSMLLGEATASTWVDTEAVAIPSGIVLGRGAVAVVDIDADAELDLVAFGVAGRGLAYRNDGAARFRELTSLLPNLTTADVVRVLPIAVGGSVARDLLVVSSAAGGAAQPPGIRLLVAPLTAGAYTDGTSRLPASVGQGFRDVAVLRAAGTAVRPGEFVAVDATNQLRTYQSVAGAVVEVAGGFAPAVPLAPVQRMLTGDVDGDTREDVVLIEVGQTTTQVEVYLRTTGATAPLFRSVGVPVALAAAATDAVLVDFDGDGAADLVATLDAIASPPIAYLGGGAGGALVDRTAARFPQPLPAGLDVVTVLPALARPRSLLLGSRAGGALWLMRGQRGGPFLAPEPIAVHGSPPVRELHVADLDTDGDADCVIAPPLGRPALLLGTERHCATVGVTQAGRQMVLRLRAPVAGSIAAWLWSPAGPARLDVPPYGLLRLAPPVISLLVVPIGPTLEQDLALAIPPASALATLHFQAAIFDPTDFSVRLSNLEPALILAR